MTRSRTRTRRAGFTMLEVIVALGILAVGMMVLVETQASSLIMVVEMDRMNTASMLAREKMTEVMLQLEQDGWSTSDVEEDGDFEDFGTEEFRGDNLYLDTNEELADYKWAYTVREIDLSLPSDVFGMADTLAGNGYFGEKGEEVDVSGAPDLTDMGISPDMITDYLGDYVREVRVLVWWGENEDEVDQVELVHHIINPTGAVKDMEQGGLP